MIDERTKNDIIEILDNVTYWESCLTSYREKIPNLIEKLKQVKNLTIPDIVVSEERTEVCDKCEQEFNYTGEYRNICFECEHDYI